MKIFSNKSELTELIKDLKGKGNQVGFVPTMGALHRGHYELLKQAKDENDIVVCSIFVNPIQFNDQRDLEKYPRTIEQDTELLKKANCDILFAPEQKELYDANSIYEVRNKIELNGFDKILEGEFRPDHFKGVAFIVKTFFEIIMPDRAYFGEKDFQQLLVLKQLVIQYQLKTKIVGCDTVREKNGLAISSRNERLTSQEKEEASFIYETLLKCKANMSSLTVEQATNWVIGQFENHPTISCEYFYVVNAETLAPITTWNECESFLGCIAVKINDIRLIDNLMLSE